MAKIRDYAVSVEAATTASMVVEIPVHEAGDLLLIFFNKDSLGGGPSTPSGWSSIIAQSSAGAFGQIFAKRADSSSEAVTLSYTTETSIALCVSIKNCYGTTVNDAISDYNVTASDDSTLPYDGGTITPTYDNSLIFSFLSTDTGQGPMGLPGWINIYGGDSGANSLAVSYTYQKTHEAITHPGYWAITQDDTRAFMLVVRDDGNESEVDAYVDRATNPCTLLTPHQGLGTTAPLIAANKGSWKTATNLTITSINGKTATWMAVTSTNDSGYNPFKGSTSLAGTSSKTVLYGNQFTFTSSPDLTADSGIVFGTWTFTLPRDYVDIGKSSTGGMLTGVASSANGRFWCIGGQFSKTTLPDKRMNYAIEVATADTGYYTTGSAPDLSAITELYILNQSYYGAAAVKFSELWLLNEVVLAGGTASNPINFLDIVRVINEGSGHLPIAVQSGSAAICWSPLRFGGGDPINCLVNLRTFQFPTKADGVDYLDFHVSNNVIGVEFYGKASDSIRFTNCVFSSDSSYYFRFNSNHNAGCNLNFYGTSVVNATVTLRSAVTLDGTTFIDCSYFAQNSATLVNCSLTNTQVSCNSLSDMSLISDTSFTSSGTGHALEVSGSAGTITFTGNTFTGFASSNGSSGNEAVYINIATGSVTINIAGGGDTPSIRTAGATVTVNNSVALKVTVVDSNNSPVENAQTAIYKSSDGTQLMNEVTNALGVATTSYNFISDTDIYIRVRKSSSGSARYYPASTTGTITSSGFTNTITLIEDTTI